ncbi:MAG: DEAD/DEAH box helicase [Patescibacteria group bacterium]
MNTSYQPNKTRQSTSARYSTRNPRRSYGRFGAQNRGRKQTTFDVSLYINKNPIIQEEEAPYVAQHTFADFSLSRELIRHIEKSPYTTPTPIQDQIIPHILEGKDVVGLANTGTGKTAAFLIPLINKVLNNPKESVIILAPTHELVIQIDQELKTLTQGLRIFSAVCVGGVGINSQLRALKRHNHFIIGTPGRTKDLIKRRAILPSRIRTAVLDEADRMLDMGFIGDMREILRLLPKEHHTLFFCATMSNEIEGLIHQFLNDPVKISVKKQDVVKNISQDIVRIGGKDKVDVLASLLLQKEFSKVIVFGRTKRNVEDLNKKLIRRGIKSVSIHGNKSHSQRQQALKLFKNSQTKILVATDVAARGIHVNNVSHVINFDLPATQDDYIHRIGRTGRGEHQGMALTLVT